jgi:hypothetical protein
MDAAGDVEACKVVFSVAEIATERTEVTPIL